MILIEKLQKYQPYHQAKLTSRLSYREKILPSNQKQIIEQAKFTYSPLRKAFQKQTKTIEGQGQNQISAIKVSGKQIIESNEVAKNNFNIYRSGIPHEKPKRNINRFVKERALEFLDIKDKIDPNHLAYVYSTVKIVQKILKIIKCQ